jgi:cell division protein ZapE
LRKQCIHSVITVYLNFNYCNLGIKDSVKVYGRSFEIDKTYKTVCWLAFENLCEMGASIADIIAIAKKFKIVAIEGISSFNENSLERVRRFINIIDVLYEHKTRVLLQINTATIIDLFKEVMGTSTDEGFAISRTISRLEQMQGLEWWIDE